MALTIPVEEISATARRADVRRALLAAARLLWTALLAVPYVLGWAAHKVVLGAAMLWTAAAVGWRDAGVARRRDDAET